MVVVEICSTHPWTSVYSLLSYLYAGVRHFDAPADRVASPQVSIPETFIECHRSSCKIKAKLPLTKKNKIKKPP